MPTIRALLDIVTAAGITSGLKFCGDPGDALSYPGSGQAFYDRSGNGNHFNLGATSGSEASDPTFNGTSGNLSANEFFSGDGGDYFTCVNNPSFAAAFHKDNAALTMIVLFQWPAGGAGFAIVADNGGFSSNIGFQWSCNAGQQAFLVGNGSGLVLSKTSTTVVSTTGSNPHCFAVSINEASPTGGFFFTDGVIDTFNPTYSSPNPGASSSLYIGQRGGASAVMPNGTRIYGMLIFDFALSQAQVQAIYYEAGLRIGLVAGGDAALSGDGSLTAAGTGAATGSASLSGEGTLTAAGSIPGAEPEPERALVGPTLLAGAPLGTLPLAAMDIAAPPASDELSLFEQMADRSDVDIIHLVKLSPLTKVA